MEQPPGSAPPAAPAGPRRRRPWLRRAAVLCVVAPLLALVTTVASVSWVRSAARDHIYTEQTVPVTAVALVLGAKVDPGGTPSPFLAARLAIAKRLFDAGKVRAVLVSGDHLEWEYDEPGAMQRWLIEQGVPPERIVLDHAGLDTYDSCLRARRIFGVQELIVVTQTYHLPRAVTLCRRLGVAAYGVGDATVRRYTEPWRASSTREHGACVKAGFDVLSGRDPAFLGPPEDGVRLALR